MPRVGGLSMAALAEFGGKDRGLGRRATADVLWDQVRRLSAALCDRIIAICSARV